MYTKILLSKPEVKVKSESSESLPRFITTWGAIFWSGLSSDGRRTVVGGARVVSGAEKKII